MSFTVTESTLKVLARWNSLIYGIFSHNLDLYVTVSVNKKKKTTCQGQARSLKVASSPVRYDRIFGDRTGSGSGSERVSEKLFFIGFCCHF